MNVLVCVKRVPSPGAKINITADGQGVDTAYLAFTTSPHEECAVEAAIQLVELHGYGACRALGVPVGTFDRKQDAVPDPDARRVTQLLIRLHRAEGEHGSATDSGR